MSSGHGGSLDPDAKFDKCRDGSGSEREGIAPLSAADLRTPTGRCATIPGVRAREAIAAEFDRRRCSNPRHSLRAFARAMGVNHATLSRLLNGRGPIQARTIQTLARPMRWSDSQVMAMIAAEDAAAIVHAVSKPAFRPDARWLASVSGIPLDRINIALQALLRTNCLSMPAANRWVVTHPRGVHQ